MAEMLDESSNLESHTVNIYRSAATVKGGRRFSFGALVIVGDKRGKVGYGYAKSKEVPPAIEKAQKVGRREMVKVPTVGTTVPHEVEGRFSASKVRLIPASPGTGVVAGATVRAVLEMAGITDCLTKCYGSTTKLNVVKATFDAIAQLTTREDIAELRGIDISTTDIEERVERGQRFMPKTTGEKMRGPTNTIGQDRRGGRGGPRGGRGGPGGGRGRGPRGGGPQDSATQGTQASGADKPAGDAPAPSGNG